MVCGLSRPKAREILPPDQRWNLGLLHWECRVLVPGWPGTSLHLLAWSPLPVSVVQNSPGFPPTLLYLCSSSLFSCSFPALFLNNSVPHIYAPGPLTFLILYSFIKRYSQLCSCFQLPSICCWLPNLYFQLISLFWVSNPYSQLPTKMMSSKGKAYSTCLIMNPSNFLPKCIPSLCFHYLCKNSIRTLMFQRIVLFIWWLASNSQETEAAKPVKGYVCSWCIITSAKLYCSNQS